MYTPVDQKTLDLLEAQLEALDFAAIAKVALVLADQQGCTPTLENVIVRLVRFIEAQEGRRGQVVLPPLSVGEMTLRLYAALNYSQNIARDLRRALNGA